MKNESGREKGENLAKKWAWKTVFAREKIEKKPKKAFHGKNNTAFKPTYFVSFRHIYHWRPYYRLKEQFRDMYSTAKEVKN